MTSDDYIPNLKSNAARPTFPPKNLTSYVNAPTVPMATPSLNLLREKFSELTRAEPHLGLNPRAPSLEGGSSINYVRQFFVKKNQL